MKIKKKWLRIALIVLVVLALFAAYRNNQSGGQQSGSDLPLLEESTSQSESAAEQESTVTESAEEPDSTASDIEEAEEPQEEPVQSEEPEPTLAEDGVYTTKEDVALYIHLYGRLPSNFITKKQAEKNGWSGGSLEKTNPGKCIGGNRFGNYEGLLPEKDGRYYTECDIDTLGASSRGAKRIVFSNDGLIYYTDDHYESFTLLYGDEG